MIYGCSEYFHLKKVYIDHYRSQRSRIQGKRSKTPRTGDEVDEEEVYEASPEEEHGIDVMAEARAFYHSMSPFLLFLRRILFLTARKVAVRRFAEGTSQIIFHDMLLDIQNGPELQQKLRVAIGISPGYDTLGGEGEVLKSCREFVEPSVRVVEQRAALQGRRETLQSILDELSAFQIR